MVLPTSGTYGFQLSNADLALEVLERVDIRGSAITSDHMMSLRRSVNLVQTQWANRGVNLWTVDLVTVPLTQGQSLYTIPRETVMMLDVYIRNFQMNTPVNLSPVFTTVMGSPIVTVLQPQHGMGVGNFVNIVIPVSVGGLIVYSFYTVQSVPNPDSYTLVAAQGAPASETGGVVPVFTTFQFSPVVNVVLPAHGLLAGDTFNVQVSTLVGGITLLGAYTVATVIDQDTFTLTNAYDAGASETVAENGGLAQIADQQLSATPYDRIMTPISRNDYAALPNKGQQSPPTQYWFDRLAVQPTVTIWPVPDQNGPYTMNYYRVRQLQDTNMSASAQTADIPYRFQEALCADTARHMAMKWDKANLSILEAAAEKAWQEAAAEDRERVSLYIRPDLSGYMYD